MIVFVWSRQQYAYQVNVVKASILPFAYSHAVFTLYIFGSIFFMCIVIVAFSLMN